MILYPSWKGKSFEKKIAINLGEEPEYILKNNTKEWKYLKLYLKVKCIEFWSSLKEQHNIYFTKQKYWIVAFYLAELLFILKKDYDVNTTDIMHIVNKINLCKKFCPKLCNTNVSEFK